VTLLSSPQYRIGSDQPGGSHRYMLFGIYPGYVVGTGGTGDVDKAMKALENVVGSGQIEVFKYSGSLGSLSCGAPFSGQGYDGTLAAMTGCPQHIVLGLPLVEGGRTYSVTTTAGSSTIVISSGTFSTSYLNADISCPGVPARAYIGAFGAGNTTATLYSYLTHAPVSATQATVNGVSQNVATSTATFLWRLHHVTAGAHDAQFTAIATAMVGRGYTKLNMTIALGWEMDGGWNWGTNTYDPSTNTNQTNAQYVAAFQHAVTVMRAVSGFNCRFEWNTNWQNISGSVAGGYPGAAYCDVVGWDAYNSISDISKYNRNQDWSVPFYGELAPALAKIAAFCQSQDSARTALGLEPMLIGHSECGVIVYPSYQSGSKNYPYRGQDTSKYWSLFIQEWNKYATRMAYMVFFNQNQPGGNNTVTEDSQLWYSVQSGTLSDQTEKTFHNTATHGPWVKTTSQYHTLSAVDYATNVKAGAVQVQDSAVPATTVGVTSIANNIQLVFA
jgi:hypothetical protein